MRRALAIILVSSAILCATTTQAADPPATWDGLVQVPSKRLEIVYLQPGADFRGYTKVMLDPTEVAFEKDWRRDHNRSSTTLTGNVSENELQRIITQGVGEAGEIFTSAWTKGGYEVVSAPGPDVLRISTGVLNIRVTAPDVQTAGRSRTYSEEAGSAVFFVEARDSTTNALLGRAVDPRIIGDDFTTWRTRVSNRADFRDEVKRWAEISVRGVTELKGLSPIDPRASEPR